MEVVMGIKPQLPATVQARLPVEPIGVTKYVQALLDYLEVTHREVLELSREHAVEHEGKDAGRVATLKRGDLVKVVQKGEHAPKGSRKFDSRVTKELYYIAEVMGQNTYRLQTLLGNKDPLLTHGANKFHADRLIKVELPLMQTNAVGKMLAYTVNGDDWVRAKVKDVSIDGRVYLQREDDPASRAWVDITQLRYRWEARVGR